MTLPIPDAALGAARLADESLWNRFSPGEMKCGTVDKSGGHEVAALDASHELVVEIDN